VKKVNFLDIGETSENTNIQVVKDTDVYHITDNKILKNLTLSKTVLHKSKETTGHSHPGQEEIYFFVSGTGLMQVNMRMVVVGPGDIILVEDGEFHKVKNCGDSDLIFNCVFHGNRNH
jgi:mannose-6-phosphate isomerase-like protein (cupin superfamily)